MRPRKRASTPSGAGSRFSRLTANWSIAAKYSTRPTWTPRSRDSRNSAGRHRGWKTRQAERMSGCRRASRPATGTPWPKILADELFHRRSPAGGGRGIRQGRDAVIAEFSALAEIGVKRMTVDGHCDPRAAPRPQSFARLGPRPTSRCVPHEMPQHRRDRRRRADRGAHRLRPRRLRRRHRGARRPIPRREAAAHAHVWSVIASGFGSIRRYELPPTTPDCVSIDHRRAAAFAPGELNAYFRAAFDLTADVKIYVEAVHRLNDVGAVCTHVAHGTSHEGFAAEWREVDVLMVEGDIVNRAEIFDEADLDAALARFEELSRPSASAGKRSKPSGRALLAHLAAGDWDAIAETVGAIISTDDRRRVVGAGVRHGREAEIADVRAIADLSDHELDVDRHRDPRGAPRPHARPLLGPRSRARGISQRGCSASVEIDADERLVAESVRPRRHRRRLRGTRRPIPRRRSGRPRAHVVGHRTGYMPRSTESETSPMTPDCFDDRPPAAHDLSAEV